MQMHGIPSIAFGAHYTANVEQKGMGGGRVGLNVRIEVQIKFGAGVR